MTSRPFIVRPIKRRKVWLSFAELKAAIQTSGIKRRTDYKRRYKEIKGAPSLPWEVYPTEYKGFPDLVGRVVHERLSLFGLKEAVRRLGIRSESEYRVRYKEIPGAPSTPWDTYAGEWIGWPDLFGRVTHKRLSFCALKEKVQKLGLSSQKEYLERCKEIPGAPHSLATVYPQWKGWLDFLGKPKPHKLLPFAVFKKKVRKLGISSQAEYHAHYKEIPGAPSAPHAKYAEWSGYCDLFGTARFQPRIAVTGRVRRSVAEADIENFLFFVGAAFETEHRYGPAEYKWRADWWLPQSDILVEYFGFGNAFKYDKKISRKLAWCQANGLKLVAIYPDDLKHPGRLFELFNTALQQQQKEFDEDGKDPDFYEEQVA